MTVKRGRDGEGGEIEALAMANCLMLLSRVGDQKGLSGGRVFTCKTCHRQFPSFQALGGHRASHGKSKSEEDEVLLIKRKMMQQQHACSICGKTFPTGQSLGGHMRRHRGRGPETQTGTEELTMAAEDDDVVDDEKRIVRRRVAVDLNLTPLQNYLRLGDASFKFVMGLV